MSRQAGILSFEDSRRASYARRGAAMPSFEVTSRQTRTAASRPRYSDLNLASAARPSRRNPSWYVPGNEENYLSDDRRTSRRAAMESYEPEDSRSDQGAKGFFSSLKQKQAKNRAGKKFERQFGGSADATDSQAGPRAAVYRGEMGSSHKRSARMQGNPGQDMPANKRGSSASKGNPLVYRPAFIAVAAFLFCILFAGAFLYPTAQSYYQSIREHDRLEAEYQAVVERNEALSNQLESLSTDEGLSAYAHDRYGWVNAGDNSVVVQGLIDQTRNGMNSIAANVVPGSVKAPQTWYSPVLDVIFGVQS